MRSVCFISLFLIFLCCTGHNKGSERQLDIRDNNLSIAFWNLENLFHPENDPLKEDDEFTPDGLRHWTYGRYRDKIKGIWKGLLSFNVQEIPEIIAVCEVESRKVMEDLFINSPFGYLNYDIVHGESPDVRGIDVGLAYNSSKIKLIDTATFRVDLKAESNRPTRDILYFSFESNGDTIFLFVNHWPSKYGGAGATEPLRALAALRLRALVDSLDKIYRYPKIICSGDFNDSEGSGALELLLGEKDVLNQPGTDSYDSSESLKQHQSQPDEMTLKLLIPQADIVEGSIKYKGIWQKIDHFIVSKSLYSPEDIGYQINPSSCRIIEHDFLLERDEKMGGYKPFRTWSGYKYNGGFSDHLPILLTLYYREE